MRKIIPYFLIIITLVLMIVLLLDKKDTENIALTINTNYTYLYTNEEDLIKIKIYYNNDKNYLTNINYIQAVKIKSKDNFMYLDLVKINYLDIEYYQNKTYYLYEYHFKMPNLTDNLFFINSELEFILHNNDTYNLYIGNLNLLYLDNYSYLNWQSLEGKKDNDNDLYLSKIIVKIEENIAINKIYSFKYNELDFEIKNDLLTINLNLKDQHFNNIPIIIESNNNYYIIPNYQYTIEYNVLEKAGRLLNVKYFS